MNKLESTIYNLVRKNPALKQFVRNMYQGIFDLLPRKKEYFASPYQYREGFFLDFTMSRLFLLMRPSYWRIKIGWIYVCLYRLMDWMSDILIWNKAL